MLVATATRNAALRGRVPASRTTTPTRTPGTRSNRTKLRPPIAGPRPARPRRALPRPAGSCRCSSAVNAASTASRQATKKNPRPTARGRRLSVPGQRDDRDGRERVLCMPGRAEVAEVSQALREAPDVADDRDSGPNIRISTTTRVSTDSSAIRGRTPHALVIGRSPRSRGGVPCGAGAARGGDLPGQHAGGRRSAAPEGRPPRPPGGTGVNGSLPMSQVCQKNTDDRAHEQPGAASASAGRSTSTGSSTQQS